MAADEVGRAFEVAAVEVQVTTAEGGAGDFEDGVGGFLDFWGWAVFYYDLLVLSAHHPRRRRVLRLTEGSVAFGSRRCGPGVQQTLHRLI
jgi:hypothetical protein